MFPFNLYLKGSMHAGVDDSALRYRHVVTHQLTLNQKEIFCCNYNKCSQESSFLKGVARHCLTAAFIE